MSKITVLSLFWLSSLIVVFLVGAYYSSLFSLDSKEPESAAQEYRESGYTFINPLLECEYRDNQGNTKLRNLRDVVEAEVKKTPSQKVSLYYRDLLNGPWYGYQEDEAFSPQSLLKLPIIFAYLKIADENPAILSETIVYEQVNESNLASKEQLIPGQEYTVEVLIRRTIQQSDNTAFALLVDHLPLKYVEKVHTDLNIPYPNANTPSDFVSVKSYSSIFRVLYNASYLSRKNSEYLLTLLSESDFSEGLVAGVPETVSVAHKFGIKNASEENGLSQLHDCGVVYHPRHPYLLCIMTKGNDPKVETETIKRLSQVIYQVIDSE